MIEQKYFEEYANYSAKVDRFFHCVNAYANSHNGLKYIHDNLDRVYNRMVEVEENGEEIDKEIRLFVRCSYTLMQPIHITNIFSDLDPCNLGDKIYDMRIYSYITCYCYQWNLFESFITNIIKRIVESEKINKKVSEKLKKARGIKKALAILNYEVFESSPFDYILPEYDENGEFIKIGFSDLNIIRERRNRFVHSILNDDIKDNNIDKLQWQYDKDMWTLRLFAQNTFYLTNKLE